MIGFNFSFVSKRIKNSKKSLTQKSSCDWVSEKILNGTYQLKHIPFLLFSYVQTDATLLANNSQHCFLLHVVGCSSAKFETGQTFSPVQTDATFGRPTTANKVGRCCVRLHFQMISFKSALWTASHTSQGCKRVTTRRNFLDSLNTLPSWISFPTS